MTSRRWTEWFLPEGQAARDASIDTARALLMLYVVGYLHLGGYIGNGESHVGWWSAALTQLVLGSFTFLSGFLIAGRPLRGGLGDVLGFYRRRLLRIYPLFLLSLAGFVALGLTYWVTAAKSALGLSMFWLSPPMTLWYVVMLLVCFVLAPLLLIGSWARTALTSVALLALMALWHTAVTPMDLRMATQFAAFASGVLFARGGWRTQGRSAAFYLATAAAVILQLSTARQDEAITAWTAVPAVCLVPILLLAGFDALAQPWMKSRWVRFLSHASFCAYLFHRIVYALLERAVQPHDALLHWLWLLGVGLPMVLAVSAFIQTAYDDLLQHGMPALSKFARS